MTTLATVCQIFENRHRSFETVQQENTASEITSVCLEIASMLIEKNKAYGDSALNPVRIFSKAEANEQIKVRMDDKLSRLMRGQAAGEDAILDLVGYYVLLRVAELRSLQEAAKIPACPLCGNAEKDHYEPFLNDADNTKRACPPRRAASSHCLLCKQTFPGSLAEHECPVKDRVNHPG